MRIAIDASTWFNRRGFGRFTRELVTALLRLGSTHRFVLLFDQQPPVGLESETVVVRQRRPVAAAAVADGNRSPLDLLRFSAAVRQARPDVLFYPAVYSWFPCPPGVPNLLTLHDAIPERYPQLVFPQWRHRTLWRLKSKLARWQATRLLTVSDAARSEIETYLGIDRRRIDVTTEGPKAEFRPLADAAAQSAKRREIAGRFGLPIDARWFTYVGGFAPHKNLLALLDAFEPIARDGPADVHLLLVGALDSSGFHSNFDQLRARIARDAALAARVHFTDFVDDELLAQIYATAVATVLPSFSEGFGLPAVESMACGTPVIAARAGPLPEIVGDAGRLFEPRDTRQLTAALRELACDASVLDQLSRRALQRAALFTWEAAARLALQSIERCARGSAAREHTP